MHVHRTAHVRFFTTLGNEVLRDKRLSFCARGILGLLLSYPDGERSDIRTLTERTPEGRERVASALRELERYGYLKREVTRTPQGRLYTEVDVFDTPRTDSPQAAPNTGFPASGGRAADPDGDQNPKERNKEPSQPAPAEDRADGREEPVADENTRTSADLLARIARAEPKLCLGRADTLRLAPMVTEWRRRGASHLHITNTLTAGLPPSVHHPARFVETRLRTKMPAEPAIPRTRLECEQCRAPVAVAGPCRACRHAEPSIPRTSAEFVQRLTRGAALARAALRGTSVPSPVPAFA